MTSRTPSVRPLFRPLLLAVAATFALVAPGGGPARASGEHAHDHGEEETARGPHGGRLLGGPGFALEVTIHEAGVPPELRVYPYEDGEPIDPDEVDLRVELHRFGGRVDEIRFRKREGYLLGDREVEEPHSFGVVVEARRAGETHRWEYESWEGRTEIAPEAAEASGIVVETARPATIRTTLRLVGRIVPNEDRLARVGARYAGVVRRVLKSPGERVAKGDVLAVVESNESMRPYEIRTPIAGTIVERRAAPGQVTDGSHELYVVADLASVWLDLAVRSGDAGRLRPGQVIVLARPDGEKVEGRLVYVSPFAAGRTQTLTARAEVPNPDGVLRPGLFATAEVIVEEVEVDVAVRAEALQHVRDWTVVYRTDGRVYQAVPVDPGRRDDEWVEIRSGVEAGQRYVARGSFVVKADVGKAGAAHEH